MQATWTGLRPQDTFNVLLFDPEATLQGITKNLDFMATFADRVYLHTANGGAPYAGGLRLDTPFGYMLTPNITPDPDTGIGRWSSADFHRALHDGVNKRNQDMYPTMPYDFYTRVTRADVDALYAYLRTVKPVRSNTAATSRASLRLLPERGGDSMRAIGV